jgi:hypothetical protein
LVTKQPILYFHEAKLLEYFLPCISWHYSWKRKGGNINSGENQFPLVSNHSSDFLYWYRHMPCRLLYNEADQEFGRLYRYIFVEFPASIGTDGTKPFYRDNCLSHWNNYVFLPR